MKYFIQTKLICLLLISFALSGCAVTYYPLKNKDYFKESSKPLKKAVVLPFDVYPGFYYSMFNTAERAKEKVKIAREFVIKALKEELGKKNISVIGAIPIERYMDNAAHQDDRQLVITGEILDEYNLARTSIGNNLNKEKGEGFDYSVGLRVKELNGTFPDAPDIYVYVYVSGYVANLAALEDNAGNTALAIFSLGMTKLMPVSEDTLFIDMTFIDADTGDIIWIDNGFMLGRSMLIYDHVRQVVQKVLDDYSIHGAKNDQ